MSDTDNNGHFSFELAKAAGLAGQLVTLNIIKNLKVHLI